MGRLRVAGVVIAACCASVALMAVGAYSAQAAEPPTITDSSVFPADGSVFPVGNIIIGGALCKESAGGPGLETCEWRLQPITGALGGILEAVRGDAGTTELSLRTSETDFTLPGTFDTIAVAKSFDGLETTITHSFTVEPPLPTSIQQCKKNGWKNFGTKFKNQGQCIKFVETGR
jgi:hypothetical protein